MENVNGSTQSDSGFITILGKNLRAHCNNYGYLIHSNTFLLQSGHVLMEFRVCMKLTLTVGENSVTPAISHRYNDDYPSNH